MASNLFLPPWCEDLIKPGTAAIDVGANLGEFILPLSRAVGLTGRVFAIEPGPLLREKVLGPIASQYPNVSLHAYAFGDTAKSERVFHYRDWSLLRVSEDDPRYQNREYHPAQRNELKGEFTAEFIPLDAFVNVYVPPLMRVGIIKIDVDGAELSVLRGAAGTIKRDRPLLYVEIGQPTTERFQSTASATVAFLVAQGYCFVVNDHWNPLGVSDQGGVLVYLSSLIGEAVADCLCLPKEHPACQRFFPRKEP